MNNITFSVIEIFISLIVETVILGGIFTFISNKAGSRMEMKLNAELKDIETQNKAIYEALSLQNLNCRNDIISQIKESANKKNG